MIDLLYHKFTPMSTPPPPIIFYNILFYNIFLPAIDNVQRGESDATDNNYGLIIRQDLKFLKIKLFA